MRGDEMFPNRPRNQQPRQGSRRPPTWIGRPPQNPQQQSSVTANLLSSFRDQDGQLDFNKMTEVASQVGRLYGQVSPLITTFFKK
jgi:hypothetical protein